MVWAAVFDTARAESLVEAPQCETGISCAAQAVVSVLPIWPDDVTRSEEPEGSGVVVGENGLIATANHVIGPARRVLVRTMSGTVMPAKIVLRDPQTDIALLRVSAPIKAVRFAEHVDVGERGCAIGNAFGLDLSVTCGVVSAVQVSGVGFNLIEDFVQTDAAVNPGMSGGALVSENGELLGMLSAIFTKKSDSNIGVNFAVSARLLRRVMSDFAGDGKLDRIVPGLLVRPSLKPGETGLMGGLVVRVEDGTAEEKAGIQPGDILLSVNHRRIRRAGSYRAALALTPKGERVLFEILRNGEQKNIMVSYN